jgi:hypothetical protein
MTHCAVEQSWLPLTRFAIEQRSVRMTQCADEPSSIRLLNLEMSKDRSRCPSARLRQNREMCVTNAALGPAKSIRDHSAFSNLCQAAPMKGSNEVFRNACRYRYAPSSNGDEDRPPGCIGQSCENSKASLQGKPCLEAAELQPRRPVLPRISDAQESCRTRRGPRRS